MLHFTLNSQCSYRVVISVSISYGLDYPMHVFSKQDTRTYNSYSYNKIKTMANYDALVILVMYWLKR